MNGNSVQVIDVIAPDGRGVRFDATGQKMIGLREPPKPRNP
jgi:hypothetical protein